MHERASSFATRDELDIHVASHSRQSPTVVSIHILVVTLHLDVAIVHVGGVDFCTRKAVTTRAATVFETTGPTATVNVADADQLEDFAHDSVIESFTVGITGSRTDMHRLFEDAPRLVVSAS